MLVSLVFTTLVANTVESQSGSDGSPYEKHVDTKVLASDYFSQI